MDRAERERKAYDEDDVQAINYGWHRRFPHVFESPNTRRHEELFDDMVRAAVAGRTVVDIGCGYGRSSERLLGFGAARVQGIDVSETAIARAKKLAVPGKLEFAVGDITRSLDGSYDVVFGRAVLHHLDYRPFLRRVYERNLADGGSMIFMEPFGSNLLVRLFTAVVRSAHTPDERSFTKEDVDWLEASFDDVEIRPINYLSLPAGLVSSLIFRNADNALLRLSDRIDVWLARRARRLWPSFRQAIIVIRKHA